MEPLNKEKRIKREIANSNERRRMQSINAGFQKLKRLLPVNDGEKISKANILQHAADFISNIERDRIMLAEQNTLLRRVLLDLKGGKIDLDAALSPVQSPTPNSMLSVPLKLTMADLDSRDSTPAHTPTPAPSTPGQLAASDGPAPLATTAGTTTTTTTTTNTNTGTTTTLTTMAAANSSPKEGAAAAAAAGAASANSKDVIPTPAEVAATTQAGRREAATVATTTTTTTMTANASPKDGLQQQQQQQQQTTPSRLPAAVACTAASPMEGLQTTPGGMAAKAAIALPLEVPYTTEVVIKSAHSHHQPVSATQAAAHHQLHQQRPSDEFEAELMTTTTGPRKLLQASALSLAHESQEAVGGGGGGGGAPKGQNLETICKAIMEIEGDRVFKNRRRRRPAIERKIATSSQGKQQRNWS